MSIGAQEPTAAETRALRELAEFPLLQSLYGRRPRFGKFPGTVLTLMILN